MTNGRRLGGVAALGVAMAGCLGMPGAGSSTACAQEAAAASTSQQAPLSRAELLAAARSRALEEVLRASRGSDPFLRANALEAIEVAPERALPLAQLGLKDAHPAVRFAAAVTIGKIDATAETEALRPLLEDPDRSVRGAALFALHQQGAEVDLSPLASMLTDPQPGVRANAALLLGLIGDPSAVPMMQELAANPLPRSVEHARVAVYRLQMSEVLAQLGDEKAMHAVRAGAYSNYDEVRILALQAMGRLQDRQMRTAIYQFLDQPTLQLQLAAAESLLRMGDDLPIEGVLQASRHSADDVLSAASEAIRQEQAGEAAGQFRRLTRDPAAREAYAAAVRSQAAFVLGLSRQRAAAERLQAMLDDPSAQVRLAAAAAVLRAR